MKKTGDLRSLPPDKLFSRYCHFDFTDEGSLSKNDLTVSYVHTKMVRPWAEKAMSKFHHAVYVNTAMFYMALQWLWSSGGSEVCSSSSPRKWASRSSLI